MKKKKISGQQIKFIINMVSLLIFAVSYLYIYTGYVDKKEAAYKEVEAVKNEISAIEKKISEEATILKQTEEINAEINAILDSYPVNITKVDNLMFAEQLQQRLGTSLTSIDSSESNPFYDTILPIRNEDGTEVDQTTLKPSTEDSKSDTPNQTDSLNKEVDILEDDILKEDAANSNSPKQAADAEPKLIVMTGTQSIVTMNFQTTYTGFKKLLKYINDYPEKTMIDSVSVSSDSLTGNLTGVLVFKRFALTGTGKVYKAPVIDDISIGTDNIFGTDTSSSNQTDTTNSETEVTSDQ